MKNLVVNPEFTDALNPWMAYPNEMAWWKLEEYYAYTKPTSLRVDLPLNTGDPPIWSHCWNVRTPIKPGQRVIVRGFGKTFAAKACVGVDFWSELTGGKMMRGFRSPYIGYYTDPWTPLKLEKDSDIWIDMRVDKPRTLVAQPGEKAVIIWFEATKERGDGTLGRALFDHAELYIITPKPPIIPILVSLTLALISIYVGLRIKEGIK